MTRVSIAMAVYNGGKYINEQLGSIVSQLTEADELVISDNMSTDDSRDIILSYAKLYPNIKFFECNEQGIVANFENAIIHCSGKYVLLADQDDVWNCNKIEEIVKKFNMSDAYVILHDCDYVNEYLEKSNKTLFEDKKVKIGYKKNLWKNSYQGCCLAFKSEMIPVICPIPRNLPIHDQWIGLLAEKLGRSELLYEKLILHRKYKGSNSTKHISIARRQHNMKILNNEVLKRLKERNIEI